MSPFVKTRERFPAKCSWCCLHLTPNNYDYVRKHTRNHFIIYSPVSGKHHSFTFHCRCLCNVSCSYHCRCFPKQILQKIMKRRTYLNPLSDISNVSTVTQGSQCHTQNELCRTPNLLNGVLLFWWFIKLSFAIFVILMLYFDRATKT